MAAQRSSIRKHDETRIRRTNTHDNTAEETACHHPEEHRGKGTAAFDQADAPPSNTLMRGSDGALLYMGETVCFYPSGIFSKYGFDDGDLLADLLHAWADSRGMTLRDGYWKLIDSHLLLFTAYRSFVELPGWEPVIYVRTSHNPVRASCEWDGGSRSSEQPDDFDAAPVVVPVRLILELAEKLFPERDESWHKLHDAVFDLWSFGDWTSSSELVDAGLALPEELSEPASLVPIIDRIVEAFHLTDEECDIMAHLIKSYGHDMQSTDRVAVLLEAVETGRAVLS